MLLTITIGYWVFVFPHIGEYWIDPVAKQMMENINQTAIDELWAEINRMYEAEIEQ